jgi:hypothetical protein
LIFFRKRKWLTKKNYDLLKFQAEMAKEEAKLLAEIAEQAEFGKKIKKVTRKLAI